MVTPAYPGKHDLYRGAFIHRRVKHYLKHGVELVIFETGDTGLSKEIFDDVTIIRGTPLDLEKLLGKYSSSVTLVLVHFVSGNIFQILQKYFTNNKIIIWIHGYEARNYRRLSFNFDKLWLKMNGSLLEKVHLERMELMRRILPEQTLKKVFVSDFMRKIAIEDSGCNAANSEIIPNYIDQNQFQYRLKSPDMRFRILCIRPFTQLNYGYDLIQQTLILLSKEPYFDRLSISVFGFGENFNKTVNPLKRLPNIKLTNKMLTHAEIAQQHSDHGVLLHPTRFDTQGVSMGEAMSSGLVVVTNKVAAIPEFADATCVMLAKPEDPVDMVEKIHFLTADAKRFQELSANASARAAEQCGRKTTVDRELFLIEEAASIAE